MDEQTANRSSVISTAYTVIESGETWEEIDGQWKAIGTGLVYRKKQDGQIYYGWSLKTFRDYRIPSDIFVADVVKEVLIPVEAYCPLVEASHLQASVSLDDVFVKRHPLQSYDWLTDNEDKRHISKNVLRELTCCEQIKRRAHPNLAEYLGCQVIDGRISGLCFRRYEQTLQEVFNPGSHSKRDNRSPRWSDEKITQCLDPIESAARHLHSMGIVHNDINPANIMFDQAGNSILIDFGSCRPIGHNMEGVGRTYEWHDNDVTSSLPSNDLDAISEMRKWLSNGRPDEYLF